VAVLGTGKVLVWKDHDAYGFISPDQPGVSNGRDLFFHATDVTDPKARNLNARVAFEVVPSERGYKAVNVRLDGQPPRHACQAETLSEAEFRDELTSRTIAQQMVTVDAFLETARRHGWVA